MSKKSKKIIKIVNIDGQIFHTFWAIWEISMKVSGMMWLMITLEVTKKQSFALYLENTFGEKLLGEGGEIDLPQPF